MTSMQTGLIVSVCFFCNGVMAQSPVRSIDGARYTTSDGVEVIQNRAKVTPAGELTRAPRDISTGPTGERVRSQIRPVSTPSVTISRGSKSLARSESEESDRRNILTNELVVEVRELEAKRKLLKSPRGTNDLVDKMYTRLEREVDDHQENIRALNREIRREYQR